MMSQNLIQRRNTIVKMLGLARKRLDRRYTQDLYLREVFDAASEIKKLVGDLSGEAATALTLAIGASIPILVEPGKESWEWRLFKDAARAMIGEF